MKEIWFIFWTRKGVCLWDPQLDYVSQGVIDNILSDRLFLSQAVVSIGKGVGWITFFEKKDVLSNETFRVLIEDSYCVARWPKFRNHLLQDRWNKDQLRRCRFFFEVIWRGSDYLWVLNNLKSWNIIEFIQEKERRKWKDEIRRGKNKKKIKNKKIKIKNKKERKNTNAPQSTPFELDQNDPASSCEAHLQLLWVANAIVPRWIRHKEKIIIIKKKIRKKPKKGQMVGVLFLGKERVQGTERKHGNYFVVGPLDSWKRELNYQWKARKMTRSEITPLPPLIFNVTPFGQARIKFNMANLFPEH